MHQTSMERHTASFPKHRNCFEAQPFTNDHKLPWGTMIFENEAGYKLAVDKYSSESSHKSFFNEHSSGRYAVFAMLTLLEYLGV